MLCLRFDVDTVGDCAALPYVVSRLKRFNARATFFITTGYDRAGLNYPRYLLRPWSLLGRRIGRRYGYGSLLESLTRPRRVESIVDFQGLSSAGHEVSLHGYEHTLWIRDFREMGQGELKRRIRKGWNAFREAAGFEPTGFASPGFKASDALLLALESFEFKYSSDFLGGKPFYPVVMEERLHIPQIPVGIDIESAVESHGLSRYLGLLEERPSHVAVAYMHPSYCRVNGSVLDKTLERADDSYVTFSEVAHSI